MTFIFIVSVLPSEAASVKRVMYYGSGSNTISCDITGDGKNDKIKINANTDSDGWYIQSIKVSVNGKSALTITKNAGAYYGVDVNYIKMSGSKKFLQIIGYGDSGWRAVNEVYQYDSKSRKLKNVLSLTTGLNSAGSVVKATSKSIQVAHSYQLPETGRVNWKYTYTWKNGKFRLKSSTAPVKSSLNTYDNGDGYVKYFKKSRFKAMKSLTLYTSTSQKKKAFTTKKGKVLTLKKIKVSGKKIYMQFQYGSKTGWKKVDNDYTKVYNYGASGVSGGWFYGVQCRLAG